MTIKVRNRIKVLYIAGWGRSGTTILGNILGQARNFQFVGEVQSVWSRGFIDNQECGCGKEFRSCRLWSSIFNVAFGNALPFSPIELAHLSYQQTRTLNFLSLIACFGARKKSPALRVYLDILEKLYNAIIKVTNCKVIVDSSKSPIYAIALGLIPKLDVYIVHLVRDARAVSYSYATRKKEKGIVKSSHLSIHSSYFTAFMWSVWNFISKLIGKLKIIKYHYVRYEDFSLDPQTQIDRILGFIGESPGAIPVMPNGIIHVEREHSVSGNPSRFDVGEVKIELDTRWVSLLDKKNKAIVNLIAWPFLLKYHYLTKNIY